jgi:ribosomal protein S20
MSLACKASALVLLTALMAGCSHKAPATPPPAAQAPVVPVSTMAKDAPPPQLPPPQTPKVSPPGATNVAATPPAKPHKIIHHKPKPTEQTPAASQPPAQTPAPTEQAANGAPADVSPIGQLSEEGGSVNAPRRRQILDDINSTQKGLNDIKRQLSQDEQTTATQIRTFLTKAKDALNQEDLDGASTLVTKAKVLLDELSKP